MRPEHFWYSCLLLSATLAGCPDSGDTDDAASGGVGGSGGSGGASTGGVGGSGGLGSAGAGGMGGVVDLGFGDVALDGGGLPDPRPCPYREPSGRLGLCTRELEGLTCFQAACVRNSPDGYSDEYVCRGEAWDFVASNGADCLPPSDDCPDLGAVPGGACMPAQENMGCSRAQECPNSSPWENTLLCDGSHWSMGNECL